MRDAAPMNGGDQKPRGGKDGGPNGLMLFVAYLAIVVAAAGAITYFRKPAPKLYRGPLVQCADGGYSRYRGSGTCAWHGGMR